jgi:pimeloyl-ACP methyl ester carboxylesterase
MLDQSLNRGGATLRFGVLEGASPPVMFLHGAGMDHSMFEGQATALHEAGHRVVVCDVRAHGSSQLDTNVRFRAEDALDDLVALHDTLGIDTSVLVGHSLGGNLGQEFARRHPDRVRGLVAVDCTWNTGPLNAFERSTLKLAAPMLALIPAGRLTAVMARASAATPHAISAVEEVFARMPKRTFLDVWRATVTLVHPDPGYRSPVPLALIRGELDRTGNIAVATPAWAEAEGVQERVIAGAGHVVTLDAPEASTTAILAGVGEVIARSGG